MKKFVFAMLVMLTGAFMVSCSSNSVQDIVNEAKANGKDWTVDQWKTKILEVCKAVKPTMQKVYEAVKKQDLTKLAELEKDESFKKDMKAMEEFSKIVNASGNGRSLNDDKEFEKECKEAMGVPEDFDL